MAEVAAIAWGVEEAISTTVQLGVGAYMVSKPTMPLKATFTQIATASDDSTRLSLARSGHSLSVVGSKAYIYGGTTAAGKLASNDVHAIKLNPEDKAEPEYSVTPAVAESEADGVPSPRTKHAACAFNICVAVFGGVDESGKTIDDGYIWLFVTAKSTWETLKPADATAPVPEARSSAHLFNHNNNLLLYGGISASGIQLKDVWLFSYAHKTWTALPSAPVSTTSAALSNGVLHLIAGDDNFSSDLHILSIHPPESEQQEWHTIQFPTNPLTPGPQPRKGAGLIPISTGHGRQYLLYLFGERQGPPEEDEAKKAPDPPYWSDLWTYQLPSVQHEAKPTMSVIGDAIKPAKIKDSIRSALGMDTGGHSWAEAEVLPPKDEDLMAVGGAGKVHPGPRGWFGCDVAKDGRSVVLWGGINAKGESEGDGWVIKLE